ncbi:MAG: hypothetical protein ABIK28_00030 [Planctomycetota bacterium]
MRSLLLMVIFILLLEAASFVVFWIGQGLPFSYTQVEEQQKTCASFELAPKTGSTETKEAKQPQKLSVAIHPYLGYVQNSDVDHESNTFGFLDADLPVQTRDESRVIIGVLGGSVAHLFSVQGEETLIRQLSKIPRFHGKEIDVINLALGGYKQPQQLMVLNYLIALDGQFDMVLNLDGFNEAALPEYENVRNGVYPFFPRSWHQMAQQMPDLEFLGIAGKLVFLNETKAEWARTFVELGMPYSITGQLIWKIRDQALNKKIVETRLAMKKHRPEELPFSARGPGVDAFNSENIYQELALLWKNCSVMLHKLCIANDILYLHFLQPNQYLDGSKPMLPEERKVAISETLPYRSGILKGYAEIKRLMDSLRSEGVDFFDLTMVFADEEAPVYMDNLCHVNERGNEILALAIAEKIAEVLKRSD